MQTEIKADCFAFNQFVFCYVLGTLLFISAVLHSVRLETVDQGQSS